MGHTRVHPHQSESGVGLLLKMKDKVILSVHHQGEMDIQTGHQVQESEHQMNERRSDLGGYRNL